ncbi:MAG: ATP-binding cassette domain-containing protein [Polyangiales bacterium]
MTPRERLHARLHARIHARVGTLALDVALDTDGGPLVLVGPNGAGKTTFLSVLLGVVPATRGRITVGENVLLDTAQRVRVPVEARRLGYVPQDYGLFPHLSVARNLDFALACARPALRRGDRAHEVAAALAQLGLTAHAERTPGTLSGGEKQRVALARALCIRPRALLLDEPMAALDVHARREVVSALAAQLEALSLPTIVVTHDADEARLLGQRIAVMEAGRITQCAAWDELAAQPRSAFVERFVASATRAQSGGADVDVRTRGGPP